MTTSTRAKATTDTVTSKSSTGGEVQAAETSKDLVSSEGRTTIADAVVQKIAGIAAREIDGVHDLGGSAARAVGRVREVLPGASQSLSQGVVVEVGERQAAVDLGIVADYGVAIHELAGAIRRNVIDAIEQMTGLEVTEVNIAVHDIYLAGEDDPTSTSSGESRVE